MNDDFDHLRPRMRSVAYRMLGSVADAVLALSIEEGVQGVYITINPDKLRRWPVARVE